MLVDPVDEPEDLIFQPGKLLRKSPEKFSDGFSGSFSKGRCLSHSHLDHAFDTGLGLLDDLRVIHGNRTGGGHIEGKGIVGKGGVSHLPAIIAVNQSAGTVALSLHSGSLRRLRNCHRHFARTAHQSFIHRLRTKS